MASTKQTTPEVTWAQRSSATDAEKNFIYLTISAPDAPKIDVDLKPTRLTFTGHSETKKTTYHVELEFFGEIDVENSKTHHSARDVAFVLRKKELKEEYWPRLLKESKKVHFLKTDFDKWVDEDEQNAKPDDIDIGGMGGMPGLGGDGGMGGLDFSKLGGGLGGGGDDLGEMGEGLDDDDEDEMPGLEEDEKTDDKDDDKAGEKIEAEELDKGKGKGPAASSSAPKIEEIS